jgi:two-component system LytT family response regulator
MERKLKAILIDDEEGARISLSAMLTEYCPQIEIVASCSNVPEGVLAINKQNPDVVFLDIEMPEYNGFELLDFFNIFNKIFNDLLLKHDIKKSKNNLYVPG